MVPNPTSTAAVIPARDALSTRAAMPAVTARRALAPIMSVSKHLHRRRIERCRERRRLGGGTCKSCKAGQTCTVLSDCVSLHCSDNTCVATSCVDGIVNQDETDVDCADTISNCTPCGTGKHCQSAADCASLTCTNGACAGATCSDNVQNANETDVDCGVHLSQVRAKQEMRGPHRLCCRYLHQSRLQSAQCGTRSKTAPRRISTVAAAAPPVATTWSVPSPATAAAAFARIRFARRALCNDSHQEREGNRRRLRGWILFEVRHCQGMRCRHGLPEAAYALATRAWHPVAATPR